MIFSAHVADTSPIAALKRRTPAASDVPGLRSARTGLAAPFTHGWMPRPQVKREVMVACWQDEDALDRFLDQHDFGQQLARGWHARMELVRAVGVWPGIDDDMVALAGDKARDAKGPSIAITIGTAYLKSSVPFLKVTKGLDRQFLETPRGLWGTAMTNLPQRLVASLTIWESLASAAAYMKAGAHGAAVRDHYDPAKDPTGHTFVTGGGFFGFRPIASHGSVDGRNPLPESVLA